MSKNEMLYVKDMHYCDGTDESDNNMWDDRKINAAYDKAIKKANADIAKRLATSTNTQNWHNGGNRNQPRTISERPSQASNGTTAKQWKVGMPCRAVYEVDGLEYEAVVARIVTDEECVVQFLGYENRETVKISTLKPTHGKEARTLQIEISTTDRGQSLCAANLDRMDLESERTTSPERSSQRKKKASKKKNTRRCNNFELPDIPVPDFNMMQTLDSMDFPPPFMPPPPMALPPHAIDTDEQTLCSMLKSWYMSGYYTGMYQGIKRGKELSRNNH